MTGFKRLISDFSPVGIKHKLSKHKMFVSTWYKFIHTFILAFMFTGSMFCIDNSERNVDGRMVWRNSLAIIRSHLKSLMQDRNDPEKIPLNFFLG